MVAKKFFKEKDISGNSLKKCQKMIKHYLKVNKRGKTASEEILLQTIGAVQNPLIPQL